MSIDLITPAMSPKPAAGLPGHYVARRRQGGFLEIDMVVGLAILTLAVLPLAYTFARERQVLRIEYCRGVADEIVDGEMEVLLAGAGRNLPDGTRDYSVEAQAASQLPKGRFQLTKTGNHLRLEWKPDGKHGYGIVVREGTIK
jgi:hypothetical protein